MWRLYCSPFRWSSCTIWIVSFGQTFSHWRHQIHRSWLNLWTPRNPGLTSCASSGYSTVNVVPSSACFIVVAMDFISPIMLRDHPHDYGREHQVRERQHQHSLPTDLDQLVDTDARQRGAGPLREQEEAPDLHHEPDEADALRTRSGGPAEERHGENRAAQEDVDELAEVEQHEVRGGVLGLVPGDDFGRRLRDVERIPADLRHVRRQEQHERERGDERVPRRDVDPGDRHERRRLRADDAAHLQRAREYHDGHRRDDERNLVREVLRDG